MVETGFLVTLEAIGIDQLQDPNLLGVMLVQIAADGDPVTAPLVAYCGEHLCLDFEMIRIGRHFAILQFGEPVSPVLVDQAFVFQIE
jgi:hypothetical protein